MWIFFAIVVASLTMLILYSTHTKKKNRRREEACREQAQILGLEYVRSNDELFTVSMASLRLFHNDLTGRNIIHGQLEDGTKVRLCDFFYQTVVIFESPALQIPDFQLSPEGMSEKMAAAMGEQDIDFEESPIFSDRWLLQGIEENAIRTFFTHKLRTFFEEIPLCHIHAHRESMVYFHWAKLVDPRKFSTFLDEAFKVLDALKNRSQAIEHKEEIEEFIKPGARIFFHLDGERLEILDGLVSELGQQTSNEVCNRTTAARYLLEEALEARSKSGRT